MADPSQNTGGTSSGTTTFVETESTTSTTVVPSIVSRSEYIAQYFASDLEEFLRLTHINLMDELQIPPEYSSDPVDIVAMLYDDLSHMLRDELIIGIHLLLSDNVLDANTGAYPVRYHVQYMINTSSALNPTAPSSGASQKPFGGLIAPPREVLKNSRFALLIDWNSTARVRRQRLRRPEYNFDWVQESSRFDATTVLRYRDGGLTVDGAKVERVERR